MRPTNMSQVAVSGPPERVLRPRHAMAVGCAVASLLAIAVATLTPTGGWERENGTFCLICGGQWAADGLLNVLLFAPLGASLAAMGARRDRAFLLGAVLSCVIELAQLWIPGRDSSVTDVLANALGTLFGFVLVVAAPVWLRPSAVASRRLALLWGAGVASVLAGAVLLFQPTFPPTPYFGMWTPELANIQWYRGRVLAANVGSAPVANGAIYNGPAVRAAMVARGPIVVRAIAGPPPDRLSELFGVTDDEQHNLVFLGPLRTDLVFHVRMRAALLGLEQPALIRAAGLLEQVHRGDTITVVATASKGSACLSVGRHRLCQRPPGAASGWRLVQSGDTFPSWLISTLDAVWLVVLALPLGFWPRGWRDGLPGTTLVLAALAGTQLWIGHVDSFNWLWIAVGLGAGVAARSRMKERDNQSGRTRSRGHSRFESSKQLIRSTIPLAIRKGLARVVGRQVWLPARYWWVQELLRDFAERDPNAYHRFLWSHHLAYAETYEVALRFGADKLHASRRLLFDELVDCLVQRRIGAEAISSVFEVGCSLGYNLRFLETEVFRSATVLEGCDIDAYAVKQGDAYLRQVASRVRVSQCDMADLDRRLDGRLYDVTVCAGVLMYLRPAEAEQVVAAILRHTSRLAVFTGLADPGRDNATLQESNLRSRDGTFIHNLDRMVIESGGQIVRRRWEGSRDVGGNTVYFVLASPGPA